MKELLFAASVLMLASFAICQDIAPANGQPAMIVTNLSDKLRTKVSIDPSLGIDIRRLNLDSIHADKHKSRATTVKDMSVTAPSIRQIVKVTPLVVKDEDGRLSTVDDKYVVYNKSGSTHKQIASRAQINGIAINDLGLSNFYVTDSLVGAIDMSKVYTVDLPSLTVNALNPQVAVVKNASSEIPVIVIDNSQFSVDINDSTYAELAEMKLIYSFEQNYNESLKTKAKLVDIRKLDRSMYLKWINILSSNKVCNIQLVKNRKIRKIIGEAWILDGRYSQNDKQNLMKNLDFFKSKEYSTVLVRFDGSEDKQQLASLIDDIKQAGFTVFATYVGQDNLCPCWNPYIDPDVLEEYIALVAPKCEGFFLNWRGMSNHAKVLPIEFFNYMCTVLRKYNSTILLYGEIYYGRIDPLRMTTLMYTAPTNVTGVVINNMGYYGYNTKYIVNSLFASAVPGYRKLDKVCQVIGYAPYYCSHPDSNAGLSLEQEYKYKDNVECAFRRTGYSTVTMSHDGVDDGQTYLIAKPDAKYNFDTTDNIIYDTKIWKSLEQPSLDNDSNSL